MPWFTIKMQAKANAKVAQISISEPIGSWDLTANRFIEQVKALGNVDEIQLDINSPGGDVFEATHIFNYLKRHNATVTVTVMGLAASAASLIAMAGDKIIMPANTMMMIHNPWTWYASGNADELREYADMLDKVATAMRKTYQARTGMDEEALKTMLATDTWLTAEECLANGFCDEIADPIPAPQASFDISALPDQAKAVYKAAQQLAQANAEAESDNETDPAELLGDGTEAEPFEEAPEVPQTDLDDDDDTLAKAQALAKEQALAYSKTVVELCALAGMPSKAAGFIGAGTSLDDIRAQLLTAKANSYQPIDVAQPQQQAPVLPMASNVYARRNKVH